MKFAFSGTMLRFVDYLNEIEIDAENFQAALDALFQQKPELQSVLMDSGRLRRTHQTFLNGEAIATHYYSDEQARSSLALSQRDVIYFLTAIAGG